MKNDMTHYVDAAALRLKVVFHDLEHKITKYARKPTEEEMKAIKNKVFELAIRDSIREG